MLLSMGAHCIWWGENVGTYEIHLNEGILFHMLVN